MELFSLCDQGLFIDLNDQGSNKTSNMKPNMLVLHLNKKMFPKSFFIFPSLTFSQHLIDICVWFATYCCVVWSVPQISFKKQISIAKLPQFMLQPFSISSLCRLEHVRLPPCGMLTAQTGEKQKPNES